MQSDSQADWNDAFLAVPAVDVAGAAIRAGRDPLSAIARRVQEGPNIPDTLGARAARIAEQQLDLAEGQVAEANAKGHAFDWDLEMPMDYERLPVFEDDVQEGEDESPLAVAFTVSGQRGFPLSPDQVTAMLNDLAVNTVALGGTVYVLDNGTPLTAAMVQLLISTHGQDAWEDLKARALRVRPRKNALPPFDPVALGKLNLQSSPSRGQITKAFRGWGVEELQVPILIPAEVPSSAKYPSMYSGVKEFFFDSPLWILSLKPVYGSEYQMYFPTPTVRLFTKPADAGVLNMAQALARAGSAGQVRLYKDLLEVASTYVYSTGTLNGLLGRLRKTMDLNEQTAKEPFGFKGKWRRGAVSMGFKEYFDRMKVVAPMGHVPEWAAVGGSAARNIEYATGVNLVTNMQVEQPVGAALFHVSMGSAAGLLAPKKNKGETFLGDILSAGSLLKFFCTPDATREELAQMSPVEAAKTLAMEKERGPRRQEVAGHLSLCEAKRKVETVTMAKAGVLAVGHGYGPQYAPDAKARLYYPVPSVLDIWAAFYLTYIFKFYHEVEGGHKLSYVTPLNSKTSLSLIGWSFFHGGMHGLFEKFFERKRGSVVYSDNLTPFR